jgi:hypothetical protein
LYYNPYNTSKTVTIKTEKGKKVDLYNTVSGSFIVRNVTSSAKINIGALNSAVIVCVPSNGKVTYEGQKMLVDGVVIDYKSQQK